MGRPAVVGAQALVIDLDHQDRVGRRHEAARGRRIAIDGTKGQVTVDDVPLVEAQVDENFEQVLTWADELRRMGVRTNADTPEDARRARELGAEGIGLCRTEHMFMAEDRQPKMRAMIMADDREARRAALAELLPLQQEDFEGIFEAMAGLPVTIRLLDPPLHEFLPNAEDLAGAVERARIEDAHDLPELERLLDRVHDISEENPMLGTRGVPAGDPLPRDLRDAGPRDPARRQGRRRAAPPRDHDPAGRLRAGARDHARARAGVGDEEGLELGTDYTVGTMIELPRACFVADRIARFADFFSFGTNDLTQTALGFSRDDVESKFVPIYLERKIIDRSPFETIDKPGVGWLVRLGAWVGREAHPGLKLGICGEHGGDPESVEFFHRAGLDYVSCSPYRVPIARIAAAQAAIEYPIGRWD